MPLQQQYREKGFKKNSELISHLLVAEKNNTLLMKNYENRPTGSEQFREVNEAHTHHARRGKDRGPNRDRGREHRRGGDYGQQRIPFMVLVMNQIKRGKKERIRNIKKLGKVIFDVVEEVIMNMIDVLPNTWLSIIKNC